MNKLFFRKSEIHKAAFLDESLFQTELKQVFEASWCFLGHTSQIPNVGDYHTANIAQQPLLMVRRPDQEISVLYNRCPHKGIKVLAEESGNTGQFIRCPYHAWTFKTDGSIKAIPLKKDYDEAHFSNCTASEGIRSVAAVHNYKGFIFVRLAAKGIGFEAFFGESLSTIDNMVLRSPEGRLRVVGKPLRHYHPCNWKMVMDNQTDTCHPMVAHESSAGEAVKLWEKGIDKSVVPMAYELFAPFASPYKFFENMGIRVWKNGHGHTGVADSIHAAYSSVPGYWEQMEARYGAEQAESILKDTRHNTVYFPNLMVKGPIQTLRIIHPISARESVVDSWIFELEGAPKQLLERTVQYNNLINSPCSIVAHDDVEMYERATEGLRSDGNQWVNLARLYQPDEDYTETQVVSGTSELQMRNFYHTWQAMMHSAMHDHIEASTHE